MNKLTPLLLVAIFTMPAVFAAPPEPAVNGRAMSEQGDLRRRCAPQNLTPGTTSGTVTEDDCVFTGAGFEQFEDIHLISQGRHKTRSDDVMLKVSMETTDFAWSFGIGGARGSITPDPVYTFRAGSPGVYDIGGFLINTVGLIGADPTYKMWTGGISPEEFGDYLVTASAEPATNTCVASHRVYLQGDVSFDSEISDASSCLGEVLFGPNVGAPLIYQYWWVFLRAGETVTLGLDGVEDETVTAAIIDFGSGAASLDFSEGPGDTDRSATFTAPVEGEFYVEVSASPGVSSSYTLSFDAP